MLLWSRFAFLVVTCADLMLSVATDYHYEQVAVTSSVPVIVTTPTKTLYATDCSGSVNQELTTLTSSLTSNALVTTSVLVESTLPPSTVVMESSATLADGSVVETVVTFVSTLPPTQVYEPTMVPTSTASHGSKTNAMPIVASVLGGFFGLIAIVGLIWWFWYALFPYCHWSRLTSMDIAQPTASVLVG